MNKVAAFLILCLAIASFPAVPCFAHSGKTGMVLACLDVCSPGTSVLSEGRDLLILPEADIVAPVVTVGRMQISSARLSIGRLFPHAEHRPPEF